MTTITAPNEQTKKPTNPPPASSTLSNLILPILNQLLIKYQRNSDRSVNVENALEELKNSFIYLEQSNPGSLDLFVKNIKYPKTTSDIFIFSINISKLKPLIYFRYSIDLKILYFLL